MKHNPSLLMAALAAAVLVVGCGEKPQTGAAIRSDAPPYAGSGSNFTQPGWKAGDKASWESHLKARQQYSQNEYTRIAVSK